MHLLDASILSFYVMKFCVKLERLMKLNKNACKKITLILF